MEINLINKIERSNYLQGLDDNFKLSLLKEIIYQKVEAKINLFEKCTNDISNINKLTIFNKLNV